MNKNNKRYIKNNGLNTEKVKSKILNFIFSNGINLDTDYSIIANDEDLDNIRDNDYIICPRVTGTRSWVIFFHDGDYYYAISLPKHFLIGRGKNRKKNIHLDKVIIYPIDISASKEMYRGTIMEGIYFRMDNRCFLIIDEVYLLAGQNQIIKQKTDRLNYLSNYIKHATNISQKYSMYVCQYFEINEKSLKDLYEKIKADPKIREIIFYPKNYGRKIYSYTILDTDLVEYIIRISQFYLQKTINPDVYNILSIDDRKKIDIAYIPNINTSKKCKQWFKEKRSEILLVKFQMDMDTKKWVPIDIVNNGIVDSKYDK